MLASFRTIKQQPYAGSLPNRLGLAAFGLAIGLCMYPAQSSAQNLVNEGYALAQRWCQSCHVIDAGQNASSRAPAFTEIVSKHDITDGYLRTWLSIPHTQMPDFNLTRNEISALIDYFNSLKGE